VVYEITKTFKKKNLGGGWQMGLANRWIDSFWSPSLEKEEDGAVLRVQSCAILFTSKGNVDYGESGVRVEK